MLSHYSFSYKGFIKLLICINILVVTACSQLPETTPEIVSQSRGDEYWAELAQDYPAFEVDSSSLRVAAVGERNDIGEWGNVIAWPHIPVSAAQLPDGRILTWSSNQPDSFPMNGTRFTYSATWDPTTGNFIDTPNTHQDAFCAAQVLLEDGTVQISGGNHSKNGWRETSLFNYRTNQWEIEPDMNAGRWYNTSVALPNGNVITALGAGGGQYTERWAENQGWRIQTGINLQEPILDYTNYFEYDWHPFLNLAPNGKIFHAGPTPEMHWIDPAGNGSIEVIGTRNTDWYPKDGIVVMYDEGKLLLAGGTRSGTDDRGTDRAMTIDINQSTPSVTRIDSMAHRRRFANGVVLPTGEVMVIGGNTSGIKFRDNGSILSPELWNPETQTWTELADMSVPRNYHSVALLLPDGRVWSAGSGLCGPCATNHQNAQIYSPPYLFNDDGSLAARPTINQAPAVIRRTEQFTVRGSNDIESFKLIKMSSLTHSVNTDLRAIDLDFTKTGTGEYQLTAHSNLNVMTPGYWMLFAINDRGVPSVSETVQVSSANPPPVTFALNVNKTGTGTGTVTSTPSGINCGSTCTANFNDNTQVTLTANPASGSDFVRWSGACSGTAACTVSMTQARTVTATFDEEPEPEPTPTYTLTINKTGSGSGIITSRPSGINCGSTCSANFNDNTQVTLTANPASGSDFVRWSGACSGTTTCTLSMTQARTVTATFNEEPTPTFRLNVNKTGSGTGTVTSSPSGINCGSSCSATFNDNTQVTLTANPASGSDFIRWSGACSGTTTCTLSMTQTRTVTATFDQEPTPTPTPEPEPQPTPTFRLNVNKTGSGTGTVTSSPSGINCGSSCSATFNDNTQVTLTANPASGSDFIRWSGACSGTTTCTLSMTQARTVTATFDREETEVETLVLQNIDTTAQAINQPITYNLQTSGGLNPEFSWQFGDGSSETASSASRTATHSFSRAGRYLVTVTASDDSGQEVSQQFLQIIHNPLTVEEPAHSSSIAFEPRAAFRRVWVVNPDNNSVTVLDAQSSAKVTEIPVGEAPRSIHFDANNRAWITNKTAASISIINPNSLIVTKTVKLKNGSQPYGLVPDHANELMYVVLEGTGQVLKLDSVSGAILATLDVGANPRHISINADGSKLYVSRYISSTVPGESTATINIAEANGEVLVVNTATFGISKTILLQHSNKQDTAHTSRGLPNYLGPAVISTDGLSAWLPSKQDNIARGSLRDGQNLSFENTIRSISSRLDLVSETEDYSARIDHDNGGVASNAAFGPYGMFLYVALEGSREVAVIDTSTRQEIIRFDVGRAPQGLVVSPDGNTLYTHNFMDRTVGIHDLSSLYTSYSASPSYITTVKTVAQERLNAEVLTGKQFFYDAKDTRLAKDAYISCASCHNDGGQDGRTWDLTGFGEGLRNTIGLIGNSILEDGKPLHWSSNFDEVQDFEGQIRALAGGTGLMTNADFQAGTRSEPLGDTKANISSDLDALAAYVNSLSQHQVSPYRDASGALSTNGLAGKALFQANCVSCHSGSNFSGTKEQGLIDIGTLNTTSGKRLGDVLEGLNTPSLKGIWNTAPYLHNGSALTLNAAIAAHNINLSANDISLLATYIQQIDVNEAAIPSSAHSLTITNKSTTNSLIVNAGDTNIQSLNFSISTDETTEINSFTFSSQGSLNDALELGKIKLYLDTNKNGSVEENDSLIAEGSFSEDNGRLVLKLNQSISIAANSSTDFIVTSDMTTPLSALLGGSSLAFLMLFLGLKYSRRLKLISLVTLILVLAACSTTPQPNLIKGSSTFQLSLVELNATVNGETPSVLGLPLQSIEIKVLSDE